MKRAMKQRPIAFRKSKEIQRKRSSVSFPHWPPSNTARQGSLELRKVQWEKERNSHRSHTLVDVFILVPTYSSQECLVLQMRNLRPCEAKRVTGDGLS